MWAKHDGQQARQRGQHTRCCLSKMRIQDEETSNIGEMTYEEREKKHFAITAKPKKTVPT